LLKRLEDRGSFRWRHQGLNRQTVDVYRLRCGGGGDLLTLDDEELVGRAVHGVQPVDAREVVVVGEYQEVIPVLAVPAHDLVWRAVTVAVHGVRMCVAFEPARRRRTALRRL
jgi:hypothetical protein